MSNQMKMSPNGSKRKKKLQTKERGENQALKNG